MPLTVHVWDIVDRDFLSIAPDATLGEAMELLANSKRTSGAERQSLVVVDKKNRYLGVLSMRNILNAFKPEFKIWLTLLGKEGWDEALQKGLKQSNYRLVQDYMVQVPTLKLGDDIIKAYRILTTKDLIVRAVPVVEAEKVEGVVRIPDLFNAFYEAHRKVR